MKSFLSGRAQVSTTSLQPLADGKITIHSSPSEAGHVHGKKDGAHSGAGPTVECIKQGDKVVRLLVTCSCGERIEIECLYPAGG